MEQCPSGPHQVQQNCSQHLDMAQQFPLCTGHWTELPTPAQRPRVALFLPRGKGEFSTGDGRSHPGKEPSMPDSFLAGSFLSR